MPARGEEKTSVRIFFFSWVGKHHKMIGNLISYMVDVNFCNGQDALRDICMVKEINLLKMQLCLKSCDLLVKPCLHCLAYITICINIPGKLLFVYPPK